MKVEGDLQRVVDQRVARLLVATGKSDEAIKLLGSATDSSSPEIHGDALMAQGKRDEARAQYEKALKTLDVAARSGACWKPRLWTPAAPSPPLRSRFDESEGHDHPRRHRAPDGHGPDRLQHHEGLVRRQDAAAKKAQEPAELVKFEPTLKVNKAWSVNLGKGERRIGVRQGPAVANGHVFAAAITGGVHAIDLQTGKKVWTWEPQKEKKKAKLRLSGGPGVGENWS